jgi:hypothetical protein
MHDSFAGDSSKNAWPARELPGLSIHSTIRRLTTLRERLIKIGARVVRHARHVRFQMAEVAVPRQVIRRDS